jgi:hypothetical protein
MVTIKCSQDQRILLERLKYIREVNFNCAVYLYCFSGVSRIEMITETILEYISWIHALLIIR